MARPTRLQVPGGFYHVGTRSIDGRKIFRTRRECELMFKLFAEAVRRCRWDCLLLVVMTTHYHAVFRTPEPNLAAGMCRLNGQFASLYNRRLGRDGHVFERRYWSGLIESAGHSLEACRYVALNPVRAGMCDRPEDYEWSTYAATLGLRPCPPFLDVGAMLGLFAPEADEAVARERLARFVNEGL